MLALPEEISFRLATIHAEDLMPNYTKIVRELKKERDRVQRQLAGLDGALRAFARAYRGAALGGKRRLSAQARAKIAAAQRARWAKYRAKKKERTN
jgi:vacuolar-type H+-ATPase subunit I/STV1